MQIARAGNPPTIGEELILPAMKEFLKTNQGSITLRNPADQVIRAVSLSNSYVRRRIDEIGSNIDDQLCSILTATQFSLQLDESILPGNECLLLAYVRFIKNESVVQELLFARQLETDTKGESVCRVVESFFKEKDIPLSNIIACATDGAPSCLHSSFEQVVSKVSAKTIHLYLNQRVSFQ